MANRAPTLWEDFAHGARHSPLGGMGLANFMFRLKGYSQDQINRASAAADAEYAQQQAYAKAHPTNGVSHYAHAAGSLLADMLGHTDPTYAIGAGKTVLQKAAAQAGIQFPASLVRQKLDVNTGRRKSIDTREAVSDAASAATGAVVLHGAGRVLAKGAKYVKDLVAPPEVIPAEHVAPVGQRQSLVSPTSEVAPLAKDGLPGNGSVRPMDPKLITDIMKNDQPLPARMRDVPEAPADVIAPEEVGLRSHKNFTETNIADDGTKFLNYTTKDGKTLPIKMGIEPDGTAEIAVDQFGNGANTLGPREIRSAMYDLMDMYPEIKKFGGYRRSGAGAGRVQEIEPAPRAEAPAPEAEAPADVISHDDLMASLPPANREFLESQPSNVVDINDAPTPQYDELSRAYHAGELDDVLTPAEKQDMDASVPKPIVDNTGYEAHTPNIDTPPEAANDVSRADALRKLVPSLLEDERGSLGYKNEKPSLDDIPDDQLTPEQRMAKAIKGASPLRAEQEALYTQERAKRFEAARKIQHVNTGEAGFHQELSQLTGDMPTVPSLASIRNHMSQDEINGLFDQIANHPRLSYTDSLHARRGLAKLLGNSGVTIPTNSELDVLRRVFPEAVDALGGHKTVSSMIADVINAPRSIMASTDLSAALRQGLPLIHKKEYWGAFGSMFKQLGPKAFNEVKEEIANRKSFPMMKESGLALTDIGTRLEDREERFMSNLAEQIPVVGAVVRASDRAYVGFLNKLRADTFDSIVNNAKAAGQTLGAKDLRDISKFINTATGRGDLNALVPKFLKGEEFDVNKASPLLSGSLFSPRLMASRVSMLNPAYYVNLNPIARKEALKSMLAYTSVVTTVLGLAKAAGLSVDTDPRSTDFAKIKVGNTRYDVTAGFQPYVRTFAQLVTGEKVKQDGEVQDLTSGEYGKPTRADVVGSFLRNKEAPVMSFAHDLLTGQDRDGNKLDVKHPENIGSDVGNMFVPLVIQDMHDIYQDQGAKGVAIGLAPDIFGVGVQTYKPRKGSDKGLNSTGFKADFGRDFSSKDFKKDF